MLSHRLCRGLRREGRRDQLKGLQQQVLVVLVVVVVVGGNKRVQGLPRWTWYAH